MLSSGVSKGSRSRAPGRNRETPAWGPEPGLGYLCTNSTSIGERMAKVKNAVSVPDPTLPLFLPAATLPRVLRLTDLI